MTSFLYVLVTQFMEDFKGCGGMLLKPGGGSKGGHTPAPNQRYIPNTHSPTQTKCLVIVTGHLGWKFGDYMLFCVKNFIFEHIAKKISGAHCPAPNGDLCPHLSLSLIVDVLDLSLLRHFTGLVIKWEVSGFIPSLKWLSVYNWGRFMMTRSFSFF